MTRVRVIWLYRHFPDTEKFYAPLDPSAPFKFEKIEARYASFCVDAAYQNHNFGNLASVSSFRPIPPESLVEVVKPKMIEPVIPKK